MPSHLPSNTIKTSINTSPDWIVQNPTLNTSWVHAVSLPKSKHATPCCRARAETWAAQGWTTVGHHLAVAKVTWLSPPHLPPAQVCKSVTWSALMMHQQQPAVAWLTAISHSRNLPPYWVMVSATNSGKSVQGHVESRDLGPASWDETKCLREITWHGHGRQKWHHPHYLQKWWRSHVISCDEDWSFNILNDEDWLVKDVQGKAQTIAHAREQNKVSCIIKTNA